MNKVTKCELLESGFKVRWSVSFLRSRKKHLLMRTRALVYMTSVKVTVCLNGTPRIQFTVSSRELLVLQALKGLKNLISLPPALFTGVSSVCRWIKLNSGVLKSCMAAAWVASCTTAPSMWPPAPRDKRGLLQDEPQRAEIKFQQ